MPGQKSKTTNAEEARLMSLHFLTPEQVAALSPEQHEEWKKETDGNAFSHMYNLVYEIYPHCRKAFKAARAFELEETEAFGSAKESMALYKAFRVFISFAEECAADPAFMRWIKRNLILCEQTDTEIAAKHKAERKAERKAKKREQKAAKKVSQ